MTQFLLPLDTVFQMEITANLSTWSGTCSLPSDRWEEIVRPTAFNQGHSWMFEQEDHSGAALLSLLAFEASLLPGDPAQADTIEQVMDRSIIADDLNESQLRIIAEHGN